MMKFRIHEENVASLISMPLAGFSFEYVLIAFRSRSGEMIQVLGSLTREIIACAQSGICCGLLSGSLIDTMIVLVFYAVNSMRLELADYLGAQIRKVMLFAENPKAAIAVKSFLANNESKGKTLMYNGQERLLTVIDRTPLDLIMKKVCIDYCVFGTRYTNDEGGYINVIEKFKQMQE